MSVTKDPSEKIRNQIQAGINRRDDAFLGMFFQSKATVSSSGTSELTDQQFTSSLEELGLYWKEEEVNIIFRTLDVNHDGVMDLEEFKKAVRLPSKIEQFVSGLSIWRVFADAMPGDKGVDRLRQFGELTAEQVENICLIAMPFVRSIIQDAAKKLKASFEAMDAHESNQIAKKFEVPPEMSAGTVHDFHFGLAGRIGTSYLLLPFCHSLFNAILNNVSILFYFVWFAGW
jgi:Ca2+-binding EF-hand superfamily protein